ncbi:MAG: DEAD/DEAH box helicase [Candidatus Nezhaarchaeota archaeon]|nr:DEAD/DEAH box helicase [Candidatus Nezhaarchaeota archaeon]
MFTEPPFNALCGPLQEALEEMGFREPTEPQRRAIPLIHQGENVLLIAPTGTGKTEAALLPIFDQLLRNSHLLGVGVTVLYITPLRALNRDILRRMVGLAEKLGIKVAVRHGDTTASERRKQALSPPDMLITTPETLQVLLPSKVMRRHLSQARWVVVDEVHELIGDKRGVQLSVALERLRRLTKRDFQRIGLSATIGSPEKVRLFLQGSSREVKVVYVSMPRGTEIRVEAPRPVDEDEGEALKLGVSAEVAARVRRIAELIEAHRSALVFTNTREAAELLASRLKVARPSLSVEAHHGSLSREARIEAEVGLKEGGVRALVCTSSLELGIDVGHVDLVVQYMSPRQVTRLVQRVGRSGHRAWEAPRGVVLAMTADDILESSVIASMALREELEDVEVHERPLDVLAHQLVGLALDERGVGVGEAYEVVRGAWFYRGLSREDYEAVVRYLEEAGFLKRSGGKLVPRPRRAWTYYYENVSVIPDAKRYAVVEVASRRRIGELDEDFVAVHGRPGLVFILAGRPWRLVGVGEEEVLVEEASDVKGAIPSWIGELIPVPLKVAREVGRFRRLVAEALSKGGDPELVLSELSMSREAREEVVRLIKKQLVSGVPVAGDEEVVVEGLGRMVVVHACLGSKVNEALGMLLAGVLSGRLGESVGYSSDPYRVLLIFSREVKASSVGDVLKEVGGSGLEEAFKALVRSSDLYRWRLLHVSRRLGVVAKEARLSVARRLARLLEGSIAEKAAVEEVLVDKLDLAGLSWALSEVARGGLEVKVYEGSAELGASPIAYLIIDAGSPYGLIPPARPVRLILEALKKRLMEREVKLICMFCGGWEAVRRVEYLPSEIKCPSCGAKFVAVTWRGDEELAKVVSKHLRRQRLTKEEQELLRRGQLSAGLVLTYGKQAVVAMAAKGVGPRTASRILGKPHRDEEEFYLDILQAEREYAATRAFWD